MAGIAVINLYVDFLEAHTKVAGDLVVDRVAQARHLVGRYRLATVCTQYGHDVSALHGSLERQKHRRRVGRRVARAVAQDERQGRSLSGWALVRASGQVDRRDCEKDWLCP